MSSSNNREDLLSSFAMNNHSQSSSPITVADSFDTYLEASGSASGSFQGDGLLSGDGFGATDADYGFSRYDFRQSPLVGTVQFYERHVFLCYKNPKVWPPRIETTEFDRLPRLLSAAVGAKKAEMRRETRLTICEGHDGTETSNGDVLIFPDMIRYRRLTHFDVETFVEEVLVKDGEWLPGNPETLHGSYVFICSHGSRDRRCGVCGPALVARFREEIESRSLQGNVSASPCSHIGGHKYAGNVIIFGRDATGVFAGHWYGYVAPEDVPELIEQHILKGEIVDRLWRGQMGLSEEEQTKSQEERLVGSLSTKGNGVSDEELPSKQHNTSFRSNSSEDTVRFCGNGESCCQNNTLEKSVNLPDLNEVKSKSGKKVVSRTNSSSKGGGYRARKVCNMPTWLETWERGDTYAALAVVFAAASVGVSYSLYKKLD